MKGRFYLIKISQNEAIYLRSLGYYCPTSNKTHKSKNKHYYAIEDKTILKKLRDYRESIKVK
jgi:TfoX/Sxy family transcriptional regulator of competence genes